MSNHSNQGWSNSHRGWKAGREAKGGGPSFPVSVSVFASLSCPFQIPPFRLLSSCTLSSQGRVAVVQNSRGYLENPREPPQCILVPPAVSVQMVVR